jgi:hypothetical protein
MAGGRPTKMTDDVIAKLEQAWSMGCSDSEACLHADIVPSTLYRYCEAHPEFSERKETLKTRVVLKARQAMIDLLDSTDENIKQKAAVDTLNRYDGKPKERVDLTSSDGSMATKPNVIEIVPYLGGDDEQGTD